MPAKGSKERTDAADPEHESEYYNGPSTPQRPPARRPSDGDMDDDDATNDTPPPYSPRDDEDDQRVCGVDVRHVDRSVEHSDTDGSPPLRGTTRRASSFTETASASRETSRARANRGESTETPANQRTRRGDEMHMSSVREQQRSPQHERLNPDDIGHTPKVDSAESEASHAVVPEPPQRTRKPEVAQSVDSTAARKDRSADGDAAVEVPCVHGYNTPDDDSWRRAPPRTHGFQRPFHVLQIVAWTVKVVLVLMTFLVVTRAIDVYDSDRDHGRHHPMHIALAILASVALSFGIAASAIDPSDYTYRGVASAPTANYCGTCRRHIERLSKHCKVCNRCASGFDHHCKWLNNCIGAKNYWLFYGYVAALLMVIAFGTGATLYMLIEYWGATNGAEKAFGIILLLLYAATSLPLLHLCGFHVFLMCKGLTTYAHLQAGGSACPC